MQTVSEPIDREFETLQKVKAELEKRGWREPRRPDGKDIPEIPKGFLQAGGDTAIELYREIERWYVWALYQWALADLLTREWKNDLTLLTKALSKQGMGTDEIETDPRVIAVKKAVQVHTQEAELWDVNKASCDRRMKIASRGIEVAKMDYYPQRRGENAGKGEKWPGY